MSPPTHRLAAVVLADLALLTWASYGPFLLAGSHHWSVTPTSQTIRFSFGFLWTVVLALTYRAHPNGRMWKLLLLQTATTGAWVFGYWQTNLGFTIAEFFGPLPAAVLVHLVLAFPTGRLRDRLDRGIVVLAYVIVLPLRLLSFLFWQPFAGCAPTDYCPANVLLLTPNDGVVDALGLVGLLSPVMAVIAIAELFRHWRTSGPAGRRAVAPVAFGMPLVIAILGVWWLAPAIDRDDIRVAMLQTGLYDVPSFLAPALFLVGTLRARLARGALAELAIALSRDLPGGGLRAALATTLRDPSLELAFPRAAGAGFVDPDGREYRLPTGPDRAVTRLERDEELLAVVVHDPMLDREDPGLVEAASSVAKLALANERLAAQVRAQLEEVRASRARIVEAADAERRRVERDLHDGAQQRLVALAVRLQLARDRADVSQELLDEATAELRAAVAEVRDLARGLHPPILTEAGLGAALEALAERTPIPVRVDVPDRRFPPAVEATAYYVVAEGLTNVVRYAGATEAHVGAVIDGDHLIVTVADDGAGGADPARGSGLRGLADRVAAASGRLSVNSPVGSGTAIRAELPLG